MIEILDGKGVGSGKSYFVCERIIHHLRQGGTAFASDNFRIKWPQMKALVRKRHGIHLEDDQFRSIAMSDICRLHEVTSGGSDDMSVLIVVDEAQQGLNARDWADKSKRALFDWACQSRHDNNDLLFVSQSAQNIDKQVRRIATYTWHMRNMDKFPIPGFGRVGTFLRVASLGRSHGILFCRSLLDQDGKTVLERKFKFADRAIFNCYESKSMRQTHVRFGQPILKKTLKQDTSKKPMLRFIIPLAILCLLYGGYRIYKHGLLPKVGPSKHESAAVSSLLPAVISTAPIAGPVYTVVRDKMLMRSGTLCKTVEHGMFKVNEMSALGMVTAMHGNAVRIVGPDGKLIYLLAEDWSVPKGTAIITDFSASPTPHSWRDSITVAPASSEPLTLKRNW